MLHSKVWLRPNGKMGGKDKSMGVELIIIKYGNLIPSIQMKNLEFVLLENFYTKIPPNLPLHN